MKNKGRKKNTKKRLLVFNCHESWVYQLGKLGFELDIVVGLKGRHLSGWDLKMRPLPPNSRTIELSEAQTTKRKYHCIITHNLSDLLDIKERKEPKILVIHSTIEGRIINEGSDITPQQMKDMLRQYQQLTNFHVVAVSLLKGRSWGQTEDIVLLTVDTEDYLPYKGHIAKGLRISNFIDRRPEILLWELHKQAFHDVPVTLVGHNPNLDDVEASDNWDDLKKILQSHRFYIHTANPRLEDGYNMATHEAMAAGLPVIGNVHPSSPIIHGVSGFLSDDPEELNKYAKLLLDDHELAIKMGQAAKETVMKDFSPDIFQQGFLKSIATARLKK